MSYEICNSITVVGDTIKISHRPNNIHPFSYYTTPIRADRNGFQILLEWLDYGELNPVPSANRYKWASIMIELGELQGAARLNKFIELARSNEPKDKYILVNNGYYICKYKRQRVCFRTTQRERATEFSYYEAMYLLDKYSNQLFVMRKVS